MAGPGKGGKGRANDLFNLATPSGQAPQPPPSSDDEEVERPPPPAPVDDRTEAVPARIMKPSPFAAKGPAPTAAPSAAEGRGLFKPSPLAAPLAAGPSPATPPAPATPAASAAKSPPPLHQVRVELDPRASSGEQTKVLDTRRSNDDLADLLDSTFGDTERTQSLPKGLLSPGSARPQPPPPPPPPAAEPASARAPAREEAPRPKSASAHPAEEPKSKPRSDEPKPKPRSEEPKPKPAAKTDEPARPRLKPAPAPLKSPAELEDKHQKLLARLAATPNDIDVLIRLGAVCADAGRTAEAMSHFQEAARLDPSNGFVRQRLRDLGGDDALQGLPDERPAPFRSDLRDFLAYPLQGNALTVLAIGGLALALTFFLGSSELFWIPRALIAAGLMAYQYKIIMASAQGRRAPPDLPGLAEVRPAVRVAAAYLACFGLPAVLAIFAAFAAGAGTPVGPIAGHASPMDARAHAIEAFERELVKKGKSPAEARRLAEEEFPDLPATGQGALGGDGASTSAVVLFAVAAAFGLAGALYLPAALLIASIFGAAGPIFGYSLGLATARRVGRDYGLCAGLHLGAALGLGWLVYGLPRLFDAFIPEPLVGAILGPILLCALAIYLLQALSYLVGRLYLHNQKPIGWF